MNDVDRSHLAVLALCFALAIVTTIANAFVATHRPAEMPDAGRTMVPGN